MPGALAVRLPHAGSGPATGAVALTAPVAVNCPEHVHWTVLLAEAGYMTDLRSVNATHGVTATVSLPVTQTAYCLVVLSLPTAV